MGYLALLVCRGSLRGFECVVFTRQREPRLFEIGVLYGADARVGTGGCDRLVAISERASSSAGTTPAPHFVRSQKEECEREWLVW